MHKSNDVIMLEMMTTINLTQVQPPNWETFTAYLADYIGADDFHLSLNGRYQFGHLIRNQTGYTFEFYQYFHACSLLFTFTFSTMESKNAGEATFSTIEATVISVLQLATALANKQDRQKIARACVERSQVGLITLDNNSRILDQNHIVEPLLQESGVFAYRHNRLMLNCSPKWLEDQMRSLISTSQESAYATLDWQGKIIHCVLSRVAQVSSWQQTKVNGTSQSQQFLLTVYTADTPPSLTFLQQLYSLTETEALIVAWFSLGLSAEHVAEKTGYTVNTVYSYIKKLYSAMSIHKQSQLTALVWQQQPL